MQFYLHPKRVQICEANHFPKTNERGEFWDQTIVIDEIDPGGEIRIILMHKSQETILPVSDSQPEVLEKDPKTMAALAADVFNGT